MRFANPALWHKMAKLKTMETTVTVERLSHEGRGIAMLDGKPVFIDNAWLGEVVKAHITRQHRRFYEAMGRDIENPHPARVAPPCPAFGSCGGCRLQHIDPEAARAFKARTVLELLNQAGLEAPSMSPPLFAETIGYRHKARIGVKMVPKKGGLIVGFRERYSNKLHPIDHCVILKSPLGEGISILREALSALSIAAHIPQIEIAITNEQVALVIRHLEPLPEGDKALLAGLADRTGWCLYTQAKGPDTVKPLWPESPPPLSYTLLDGKLTLEFSPLDFTQVNFALNNKMIDQALAWLTLEPTDIVWDLFCGIGNFSLSLATKAAQVYGVEVDSAMVKKAEGNALRNGLRNVDFRAQDLFLNPHLSTIPAPHKILIDPPRAGAQEIIPALCGTSAKTLLYVSCNPTTFVRDAKLLVQMGQFKIQKLGILDMFPHTEHVEVMALFTRN